MWENIIYRKEETVIYRVSKLKLPYIILIVIFSFFILFFSMYIYLRVVYPVKYSNYVDDSIEKTGLSPSLVYAVIRSESGFDPKAISYVGAKGLMQITPDTLDWVRYRLGEKDTVSHDILYNPQRNIYYGCFILKLLYDEFGTTKEVLCAYHAGFGNVKRWLKNKEYSSDGKTLDVIPFKDTNQYVTKVMRTMEIYKEIYGMN